MTAKVLIHFQESYQQELEDMDQFFTFGDGELDVIVDDVEYKVIDGIYQDPDEQLCEHYGINYDLVNCIEAVD